MAENAAEQGRNKTIDFAQEIKDEKWNPDAANTTSPARTGEVGDIRKQSWMRQSVSRTRDSLSKRPGYEKEGDHPFSTGGDDGDVDYQTLRWWQAGMIMIAETISLGILALPSTFATIGMVPGIILIAGFGAVATYTGFVIGQFKQMYPHVHSYADAGEILFQPIGMGAIGREVFGAGQVIFLVFTMSSHILVFTVMMNTITGSATCTIVFAIVALAIFWVLDLPRTLDKVSYMSIVSFVSVFSAVMITMVGVGISKPGDGVIDAFRVVSFPTAFLSVTNIVFAYAGHCAFFGFLSEMKNVKDWPKALTLLQISDTAMYLVAAIVIYYYAGPNVKSPALGSASPTVKKVAWGIAIPTILIAGVIYGHVASQYIFVRLFRGTRHMAKRTFVSTVSWLALTGTLWVIAWVIAESIPDFNDLLGLISSLFASWFSFGLPGAMWLFMNYGKWFSSPTKIFLTIVNCSCFLMGALICGIGLYASGYAIGREKSGSSWSCKSNAQ